MEHPWLVSAEGGEQANFVVVQGEIDLSWIISIQYAKCSDVGISPRFVGGGVRFNHIRGCVLHSYQVTDMLQAFPEQSHVRQQCYLAAIHLPISQITKLKLREAK